MKTILLAILFFLAAHSSRACSCFYISDYFCPSVSWHNSSTYSSTLYIAQVKVLSRYSYYMDVEVVDNLQNTLPANKLTILGQDGLNCNEWLNPFSEGSFFILAITESGWEEGVYDLSGCGRFWLPIIDDRVQGNISENMQDQDYTVFKQSIAQCAGITPIEEQGLASLRLFPNPTSGTLYLKGLETGQPLDYTLYSLAGQELQSGTTFAGPSPSLSLASLPKGIYLLRLQTGSAVLTRRIVLERY